MDRENSVFRVLGQQVKKSSNPWLGRWYYG